MKIGIMQGRLLPPVNGHIQEFPDNWKEEFKILESLGLHGVEWLVTKKSWLSNPIYQTPEMVQKYPIISVCLDTLVEQKIYQKDFLVEMVESFCEKIKDTNITNITIPLLEDSSLEDDNKRKLFCEAINQIGEKYKNINFCFEAELAPEKLMEIVSLRNNFYVTYDTGNTTSYGLDHLKYIEFFKSKIINVHLKDRTYEAKTVVPFTGDTDFELIFKKLKDINYNGSFIIQTAREQPGQEKETIVNHSQKFRKLYERYF